MKTASTVLPRPASDVLRVALLLGAVVPLLPVSTCVAAEAPASPAKPAGIAWEAGGATIRPFLSDRARVEVVDWFAPAGSSGAEGYAFVANVLRFGAVARRGAFEVTIEGQEVAILGLPDDAVGLGPGGNYFQNTADEDQRELFLRRGVLEWNVHGVEGLRVSGGRSIVNEGLETTAKDAGLSWLKKTRISQRLLGGFDYTHVGRSFDGGTLKYTKPGWDFTFTGGRPTAGGFNISANNEVADYAVAFAALTATEPSWAPRSDGRLFWLWSGDERGLVVTDNRPLAARQADGGDISIHTFGANAESVHRLGIGDLDLLAWAAGQTGEWESLDHAAWAFSLEGGYRLVDLPAKPWLRAGWTLGSGDDDPGDGDHGTFYQVLPTARLYALTPFYNMMNNDDLFVQLLLAPREGLSLRFDWHHLRVTEDEDLAYAGAGATMNGPVFGYAGFPAQGRRGLADLVDVSIDWALGPHWKLGVYYGHAFGGGAVEAWYAGGADLDYGYFELTATL